MNKFWRRYVKAGTAMALSSILFACTTSAPQRPGEVQKGLASYYAHKFHGRTTASGERYNMHAMTAAHRKLSFGTRVKVINRDNGKSVVVRINDRGPFVRGRVIDVSLQAAKRLDMIQRGVVPVTVQRLD